MHTPERNVLEVQFAAQALHSRGPVDVHGDVSYVPPSHPNTRDSKRLKNAVDSRSVKSLKEKTISFVLAMVASWVRSALPIPTAATKTS
jgi:hypothetical protein